MQAVLQMHRRELSGAVSRAEKSPKGSSESCGELAALMKSSFKGSFVAFSKHRDRPFGVWRGVEKGGGAS